MIPLIALGVVVILMLVELRISNRNERTLRKLGAVAPLDPVYGAMKWAYPGVFLAMAMEGLRRDAAPPALLWAGAAIFVLSKLFKFWAIGSLGHRWTYKVFILPGTPLVSTGPYRLMRHPNYVAVIGELVAMALVTNAWIAGPAGVIVFGALLIARIRSEERALA